MRPLQAFVGQQLRFRGTVTQFGENKRLEGGTILLTEITGIDFPEIELGHTWVEETDTFNKVNLRKGDIVEFTATIHPYRKGRKYKELDYGLYRLKSWSIVSQNPKFNPIIRLKPCRRINVLKIMTPDSNIPQIKPKK